VFVVAAKTMEEQTTLLRFFRRDPRFAIQFSASNHNQLRGITDGKAVGTYIEHKFRDFLGR
jgi:hypothetical protein